MVPREKKLFHFWARREARFAVCPFFFTKNIFSARLVFEPSRAAKKAPKGTWVGFCSCSSALATLLPPSTPDHTAGSEAHNSGCSGLAAAKKSFRGPHPPLGPPSTAFECLLASAFPTAAQQAPAGLSWLWSFLKKNKHRGSQKGSLRAFCSPWGIQECLVHTARKVGELQFRWRGGKEAHQAQCACTHTG